MPLSFHPGYGIILYCDFSYQREPEMVKVRPVVVISRRHDQLCTVVPLSGSPPNPVRPWHHKMTNDKLPEFMRKNDWWAKCDCVTTVSFARLDRVKGGKCPNTGKRLYVTPTVYTEDLRQIKLAILSHFGMQDLIPKP